MRTFEYERVEVNDEIGIGISYSDVLDLQSINTKMRKNGMISKDFYKWSGRNSIKFRNFVGLISLGKVSIEILPKIFKPSKRDDVISEKPFDSFVKMLSYVVGFKEQEFEDDYRILRSARVDLLDILIFFYAVSLRKAIKKGLYNKYEKNKLVSKYLSGKILLEQQLSKIDQTKLIQETYLYTTNTDLMRYFKSALELFATIARNRLIRNELNRILKFFDDVDTIPYGELRWRDFSFNRLNFQFENAFRQSKLILHGFSFLSGENSKLKGVSILFDMNKVFEDFVTKLFQKNSARLFPSELSPRIEAQKATEWLFQEKKHKKLKPDIQIKVKDMAKEELHVIDAKYKQLDGKTLSDEREADPIMSDLYQMFAYSTKYNAVNTVILYPSAKTGCKYYNSFSSNRKFMLWGVNLNLAQRYWEEEMIKELQVLVASLLRVDS